MANNPESHRRIEAENRGGTMKATILVLLFMAMHNIKLFAQSSPPTKDAAANASSKTFVVPEGNGNQIVIDGMFSKGEWDDALKVSISENYDIYLKVGSGNLFIGLKSGKPVGMALSEIYITSNDKEFYNLHSSMALGEGLIPFPADRSQVKFSVNNNENWEANCCRQNSAKCEKWVADGQPKEKYDEIFEKKDGKEYRIDLDKLPGARLRMMVGLRDAKGGLYFPSDGNFNSCDGWVELILPYSKR